ncbi:peroxide stress protein YaaA [Proteinivorax hydrogeniformans]|uniref:UPF0246 protein PRVXH_002469 n=1 Tax=Proteinivorax hydrogeniformans TaxID=1826727 RepID=A0AAU8HTN5_9FIRM
MRIIVSPAKKMNVDMDLDYNNLPRFISEAETLLTYLKKQSYDKLKSIWKCSDKIATLNQQRIQQMDLHKNLTPAILAYEGIQYKYMAPGVFQTKQLDYIERHLRIMSAFYGILRPFDGVAPYRLEMQAKLKGEDLNSLYDYWNSKLADQLFSETNCIVNLASKEYSKCISTYLTDDVRFVTCVFGEMVGEKVKEKGVYAKMARGEMVRFMAENEIEDVEEMKKFNRLNFAFTEELSDEDKFVFVKGDK